MAKITPIICPTRAYQGAMAYTMLALIGAIHRMHRDPVYIQASAHGYAFVRNKCVATLHDYCKVNNIPIDNGVIRGWWLDDDILIPDLKSIVEVMKEADRNGWNVSAPYLTIGSNDNGEPVGSIYKHTTEADGKTPKIEMMTVEEVNSLQPYQRIDGSGLGCYYGNIYIDYNFHADGRPFQGEDCNLFWDKPDIELRFAPLVVKHCKSVLI